MIDTHWLIDDHMMWKDRADSADADLADLIRAARRAVRKAKNAYDRLQPTAPPDECWSEFEALDDFCVMFTASMNRRCPWGQRSLDAEPVLREE